MTAPALLLTLALLAPPDLAPRPPAVPSPEAEAFRALGAAAAGGPGIHDVQAAAAREAERAFDLAEGAHRRTRLAALLPRLGAEVRLDRTSSRVVGFQGSGEVDTLRFEPGVAVVLRATWDLGGLAGPRGEVAAAARIARARAREAAVRRATDLFFARRRALVALLLAPPAGSLARADAEIEVDRLGAELDALTGGLLSRGGRP